MPADDGVGPRERWERARAFREKAQQEVTAAEDVRRQLGAAASGSLYALALADAVSSTRESLHGYISFMRGTHYSDNPDNAVLIRECAGAGLDVGEYADQIKRFNRMRNARLHRNPTWIVTKAQATAAITTAEGVDKLIAAAIVGRAPADRPVRTSVPPAATRPARRSTKRLMFAMLRLAAAALLLALGLVAGLAASSAGLRNPFSTASSQSASGRSSSVAPTPSATRSSTQVVIVGSVAVTMPTCENNQSTFQIRNLATAAAAVSMGSPDAPGARFALTPGAEGSPTLSTEIAAESTATVYVENALSAKFAIDVLAPGGTVHLSASTC